MFGLRSLLLCTAILSLLLTTVIAGPTSKKQHPLEKRVKQLKSHAFSTESRAMPEYRLPRDHFPSHQYVQLQPFLTGGGNFSFNGYTELTFDTLVTSANLTIMYEGLNIISYDIFDVTNQVAVPISGDTFEFTKDFWTISPSQNFEEGNQYILTVTYTGALETSYNGLFFGSYMANGETRYFAATQFEPQGARRAFPCFDEPIFRSTFDTSLIREDNMISAANTPLRDSQPYAPGWTMDNFQTTVIMPTYLNSYQVSDLAYASKENAMIDYGVFAREDFINASAYAIDTTLGANVYFESYFRVAYPMPKLDSAALPEFFSGAMENWGLMNYLERWLLYRSDINSARDKYSICGIINHEDAHNWFGNLVTTAWWDHIWLNEGFTEFYSYHGGDAVEPEMQFMDQFLYNNLHYAFEIDDTSSSHALNFDLNLPFEIEFVFDGITYSKGSSIVRMMEYMVQETTMRNAMSTYLETYAFNNTFPDDVFDIITAQAHLDLTLDSSLTMNEIMDSWTNQPGYPVINVTRYADGSVDLVQERFLMGGVDQNNYLYYVPITYTTQVNPNFDQFDITWMPTKTMTMALSDSPTTDQWVIFNMQEGGFYRVLYDSIGYTAIINQLNLDHTVINVRNRMQIINDAYQFAAADYITYDTALSLNAYQSAEEDVYTLRVALYELNYIDQMFWMLNTYANVKAYLLSIVEPMYLATGFVDSVADPFAVQIKRELASDWACWLGYQDCLDDASANFAQWMTNPDDHTIVTPNMKEIVYCYGVAEGSITEWDFLYTQYQSTIFPEEIYNRLESLGCSTDGSIINSFLDKMFVTGEIPYNHIDNAISSMSGNPVAANETFNYLYTNANDVAISTGSFSDVEYYIWLISAYCNTDSQLSRIIDFETTYQNEITTTYIGLSKENCQYNIQWLNVYHDTIYNWLVANGYE